MPSPNQVKQREIDRNEQEFTSSTPKHDRNPPFFPAELSNVPSPINVDIPNSASTRVQKKNKAAQNLDFSIEVRKGFDRT